MAKNKGKFGKGEVVPEQEDEFVSGINQVLNRLKPHARRLVALGIGAFVVAIVFVTYRWYQDKQSAAASALYAEATAIYQEPVWADPTILEALPEEMRPKRYHTSVKERALKALVPLDKLHSEYGSSDVAARARLFHASVLYDAGRYADAEAMYRAFAASDAPDSLRLIAREGIGYAIEARALEMEEGPERKAALEQALAAFKELQPTEGAAHRDYALYHQARVLRSLDRKDEAIALYKQILDSIPQTPLRRDISNRLAVLEK